MKIILFGSLGMLGNYVFNLLKDNYDVVCINRDMFNIEETDWKKLYDIINKTCSDNDIILNCAGIIPQKNAYDLKTFIAVNTLFPHKLNEIAKLLNLKFIHITTDCVYDGKKGYYDTNDSHNATTLYGITKSLGEPLESTIIRTSIIGEEVYTKKSLLEWIKSNKNGEINGYANHFWNGVTCLTLAKFIHFIIVKNLLWNGVKNLCSPNIVSKYDLCCFVNEIYKLNINVNKINDKEEKNMTLIKTTLNFDFIINNIYEQIRELYEFNLNNLNMINNSLFYCNNKDTYPPFKNGLYLEEYFFEKIKKENIKLNKKYIPALWTNFQIEHWFEYKKYEMQQVLNNWILENPSENGYFTLAQYDDGPKLILPSNTIVYGACSGDIPIPLIYQDTNNTLENIQKKNFTEKHILCSFVGNITSNHIMPNVRQEMFNLLKDNSEFTLIDSGGWTPDVNKQLQIVFIETTISSKFALAPRGYGRASFRFFECFQLGTIPIYIWNDINWLPFQNIINYNKLCIVIHVSKLHELHMMLSSITETQYNSMLNYYDSIKHLFTLEGMSTQIIKEINS